MGAAVGGAVLKLATSAAWYAVVIRTIIINVMIGSLEFSDGGDTWVACDD